MIYTSVRKLFQYSRLRMGKMKVFALVLLAAVLVQSAEIRPKLKNMKDWRNPKELPPRSILFPRPAHKQGPGYFVPTEPSHAFSTKGFCGAANSEAGRIVGGEEATPHEFPWQVAIVIDNAYFCGGSLIAADWVMTAAHCADGAVSFQVTLGAHNKNIQESTQVRVTSNEYTIHPRWNSNLLTNDLALIKLPTPVTFTPEISPICIAPSTEPDHIGDSLLVSGWGRPSDATQSTSATLNKVIVTAVSTDVCKNVYGNTVPNTVLCCDTTGGHGTCNGDSGGPLSFIDANQVFHQVGVVSFGATAGCELGYPIGFTRVSDFADWISSVTGIVL